VVSGDSVRLTYICGNTFRIRNANDAFVEVKWDIYNTPDSGRLVLPKRPNVTAFSQVFVTAARRGTMRVFVNGRLEETKSNGNRPTCSTEGQETAWPAIAGPSDVDVSKKLIVRIPDSTIYYRVDMVIRFRDSVSVDGQRAFLRNIGAAITSQSDVSVNIRLPDVGADSARYFNRLEQLSADPRVRSVSPIFVLNSVKLSGHYPTDASPDITWDQSRTISLGGTLRARRDFLLEFLPEVDANHRLATLSAVGATPTSRTGLLTFVIRTPDPGADSTAYVALLNRLRALPGVKRVAPVYLSGGKPMTYPR
jgi:hypothetical protein